MSSDIDVAGDRAIPTALPFATEETYLHATARAREEELVTMLSVRIGHEVYGLPTEAVREIIKLVEITEVPRMPAFMLGVISVRGAIIPVIDLRVRLALTVAPHGRGTRIVIVTSARNQRFGLLVDGVVGLEKFRAKEIEPTPSVFGAGRAGAERYIGGLGRAIETTGRIVVFVELEPLIDIRDELRRHRLASREHGQP